MLALIFILGETTIITWLVTSAIGIGLSYLAARLGRPRPRPQSGAEQQPTLSQRGSYLPYLLGRRRIAPIVGWVGNRQIKKIKKSSFFGLVKTDAGEIYKEAGWHMICLGPVDRLHRIWEGGRVIWDTMLERSTTPNGSVFEIKDFGTFRIYWGTNDQPVDAELRKGTGIGSRWPRVCWVGWFNKAVNPGWSWNQMEYEVERWIKQETTLQPDVDSWVPQSTRPIRGTTKDDGINPGHAIWFFATAKHPYGLGIPAARIDAGSMEALSTLMLTEHLPCNVLARDGVTGDKVLKELMHEVGFVLPQVGDKLVAIPIRQVTGTVPQVTLDVQIDPLPEIDQQHGDTTPSRNIYLLYDRESEFKIRDASDDNDAQTRMSGRVQPQTVQLENITDRITGQEVMRRLVLQESVDGLTYNFRLTRGARNLVAGQVFDVPSFGRMRAASRRLDHKTTVAEIEAAFDQYGSQYNAFYPPDVGTPDPPVGLDVAVDPYVFLRKVPDVINEFTGKAVWVLRVRAHDQIIGASVFMSANGTTFARASRREQHVAGGTINRPIDVAEPTHSGGVITDQVTFTPYNSDIDEIDDLTGNDEEWLGGDQIAVIGTEFFLLRSVQPTNGGYILDGLKRAQFGTVAQTHPQGTPVLIFNRSDRLTYRGHIIQTSPVLYVKTLPHTDKQQVGLADVTAVSMPL